MRRRSGNDIAVEPARSEPDPTEQRGGRLGAACAAVYAGARAAASRKALFRLLGMALIIYGAVGLAAALYGHALIRDAFAGARDLGGLGNEQGRALQGLTSISATLDDAAMASTNMSGSFKESQASLTTASQVAADVAASFRQVAAVAGLQVFGMQPMAGLAQPFGESSERLDDLSEDLTRTSAALGANSTDMQRLAGDFRRLKSDVEGLRQSVARLPIDPTAGEGARRLETALLAMLVWIGLQGLASLFAGLAILLLPLRRRMTAAG